LCHPRAPPNLLAHFAEGSWAEAANALEKALAASAKRDAALVVVGVLGTGGVGQAASATLDADVTLLLTEDPSGGWAAAFGISKAPATVLVGPDGAVRWKDEAALDTRKLGKLLDEHLEPGGEVSWRELRPAVAASDTAPDAPVRFGDGRELALRRLRGGSVVLSFWTSSSEPSLEQLRELRERWTPAGRINRTSSASGTERTRSRSASSPSGSSFLSPLVPDPERLNRQPLWRLELADHRPGGS